MLVAELVAVLVVCWLISGGDVFFRWLLCWIIAFCVMVDFRLCYFFAGCCASCCAGLVLVAVLVDLRCCYFCAVCCSG